MRLIFTFPDAAGRGVICISQLLIWKTLEADKAVLAGDRSGKFNY